MLTAIETTDHVRWNCLNYDGYGDLVSCGQEKVAHIAETAYQNLQRTGPHGAVIALPKCACGTQTFLKADYTLKDVWKCSVPIPDASGHLWTYGVWPRHARNLLAHALHAERGSAPFAPVIAPPPIALIEDWHAAGHPPDVLYALWYGWRAYEEYGRYQAGVAPIAAPSVLLLPGVQEGAALAHQKD